MKTETLIDVMKTWLDENPPGKSENINFEVEVRTPIASIFNSIREWKD